MNDDIFDMSDVFTEYGTTQLHPVTIVFMLGMAAVVMWSKRPRALLAIILVCVFMPAMQRVVVGGLDFSMMRLILIIGWIRVLARGEYRGFKPGKLDLLFVLWTAAVAIVHVLRVGPSGIVFRLGTSFDALTVFFLFRVLVRRREQVFVLVRQIAWISIVMGLFLGYEMLTRNNVFGVFGSAPPIAVIRDGTVRAQGSFSHPVMMGTFGAVLVPFFVAVLRGRREDRRLMAAAIVFSTIIVVSSGSSGPFIAWATGWIGWGLWRLRKQMRAILGAMLLLALFLHLVREKPVWHLIGRLASITGGTGYHRYRLIDAFVGHFSDWALLGTDNTGAWGWGLQDTTNHYIRQGVYGGLLAFVLFLVVLGHSFSRLRRTRVLTERAEGPHSLWTFLVWGFSVALVTHCVSFISTSYFGQMEQFFFISLAMIPALVRFRRPARPAPRPEPQARATAGAPA